MILGLEQSYDVARCDIFTAVLAIPDGTKSVLEDLKISKREREDVVAMAGGLSLYKSLEKHQRALTRWYSAVSALATMPRKI